MVVAPAAAADQTGSGCQAEISLARAAKALAPVDSEINQAARAQKGMDLDQVLADPVAPADLASIRKRCGSVSIKTATVESPKTRPPSS